jgi:peptide/nickel transport system substrate-binding protein
MVGAGSGENFNPFLSGPNLIGIVRAYQVFDTLVRATPDPAKIAPGIALEWSHNPSATVWKLKIRPNVTFHNGKALTLDDVIYSLRAMGAPQSQAAPQVADVALRDVRKSGKDTIIIPLTAPDVLFPYNLTLSNCAIVAAGAKNFTHPIGTGGFAFQSLVPGQQSVCTRNPHYWDDGKPYVDSLEIASIDDNTARLNALLGGQIDVMGNMPFAQARAQSKSNQITVLNSPSVSPYAFYVRTDVSPFTDVRVRQALKYVADRQALINVALDGYGVIANDLFGKGLPFYASDIPQRVQDIDKAKFLLKQAGRENLQVTLYTAEVVAGFTEAATLYAQQAKKAGITVNLKTSPANAYWDPSLLYLKQPFAQTQWIANTLQVFYVQALGPKAPLNETHWKDPKTNKLLHEATTATNPSTAAEKWHAVQEIQFNTGGYLMYTNVNIIDATSTKVKGIVPTRSINLGMPTGFFDTYFA